MTNVELFYSMADINEEYLSASEQFEVVSDKIKAERNKRIVRATSISFAVLFSFTVLEVYKYLSGVSFIFNTSPIYTSDLMETKENNSMCNSEVSTTLVNGTSEYNPMKTPETVIPEASDIQTPSTTTENIITAGTLIPDATDITMPSITANINTEQTDNSPGAIVPAPKSQTEVPSVTVPAENISFDAIANLDIPEEAVGISTYVFIGKLESISNINDRETRLLPDVLKEYEIPFTECSVTVLRNIKGCLTENQLMIYYKCGGTDSNGQLFLYDNDTIPRPGGIYLFRGITYQDGTMSGGGKNSTIELENGITTATISDSAIYKRYVTAFENQIHFINIPYLPYLAKTDINYKQEINDEIFANKPS